MCLFSFQGSSPLTRGKRACRHPHQPRRGLIPAHAGKTCARADAQPACRAHPRSRGENPISHRLFHMSPGSSPLTRGKLGMRGPPRPPLGLIPAHAGKTKADTRSHTRWWAHPRSRGENGGGQVGEGGALGSSPLTRGKLPARRRHSLKRGLIPAHAGKTSGPSRPRCRWWAHPRSRGENLVVDDLGFGLGGSSPLTRGKLHVVVDPERGPGLIPAHAGKTSLA